MVVNAAIHRLVWTADFPSGICMLLASLFRWAAFGSLGAEIAVAVNRLVRCPASVHYDLLIGAGTNYFFPWKWSVSSSDLFIPDFTSTHIVAHAFQ
jgi:hypothetical protein